MKAKIMSATRKRLDPALLLWVIEPILATDAAHEQRIAEHLEFVNQVQRPGGMCNDQFEHLKRGEDGRLIVGYRVVRGTEVSATFQYCPLQYSQRRTLNMAFDHLKRLNGEEAV